MQVRERQERGAVSVEKMLRRVSEKVREAYTRGKGLEKGQEGLEKLVRWPRRVK